MKGEFEKRKFLIENMVVEYVDTGRLVRMRDEKKFFPVRPLPKELEFVPLSAIADAEKEFPSLKGMKRIYHLLIGLNEEYRDDYKEYVKIMKKLLKTYIRWFGE